jgi:hypothetical protein
MEMKNLCEKIAENNLDESFLWFSRDFEFKRISDEKNFPQKFEICLKNFFDCQIKI